MVKERNRVIIDTNLWISFLISNSYAKLDRIFSNKSVTLLYSQDLIDEFIEVASRSKFRKYFSPDELQDLLLDITKIATFIEVTSEVIICRDSKDNFLLALAKDGKATHLITGDQDILALKFFGRTRIVSIKEYMDDDDT